ncbi:Zn-ribbon domain-containing OB-fold protein [Dactylosporangium sp. CA-092794]|uniref:Zn-ribbon domain-containing OB-fold protein n=1 Tax=Dactylosporangium sp. CA-092794 TaxID=3239929 RepID=UPI003D9161B9
MPTPESLPFWAGTLQGELRLQRCEDCERHYFYPRVSCRYCGSPRVEWRRVSGRGRLLSYIINHRMSPAAAGQQPIIALVELDEGPRMMTNIVGVDPDPDLLALDARVTVDFEPRGDQAVPVFRLEASAA